MNETAERLLEKMREYLARAAHCDRGGWPEQAEAFVACAANKLALAIREDNVTELDRAARFRGSNKPSEE